MSNPAACYLVIDKEAADALGIMIGWALTAVLEDAGERAAFEAVGGDLEAAQRGMQLFAHASVLREQEAAMPTREGQLLNEARRVLLDLTKVAGRSAPALLALIEHLTVGAVAMAALPDAQEGVLQILFERVKERLAEHRLMAMPTEGTRQ